MTHGDGTGMIAGEAIQLGIPINEKRIYFGGVIGGYWYYCTLVALFFPAINKAKSIGQRVACINNQKQLQMAHIAFSDDHGDKILYSSAWKQEKSASYAWMAGSLNLSTYWK